MATTFAVQAMKAADPNVYDHGLMSFPEGASQTFIKGAVLELESGYLVEYDGTGQVVGIAAEAGHNDGSNGDHETLVVPAKPGFTFIGCLNDTLAATDLGASYGLVTDPGGSGNWVIDRDDTTDEITIERLYGMFDNPHMATRGAVGDTNVLVEFSFNAGKTIFSV